MAIRPPGSLLHIRRCAERMMALDVRSPRQKAWAAQIRDVLWQWMGMALTMATGDYQVGMALTNGYDT